MQTVTVHEFPGVASAQPEPAEATTPIAVEVIDGPPGYGEFECEWALDLADQ
jgi:hypothetical protein